MLVQLPVKKQNIVSLLLGTPAVGILRGAVSGVQIYHVSILVGLGGLDKSTVLPRSIVAVGNIAEQEELACRIIELLVGQHSILDEDLYVIPFLLELGAVIAEHPVQLFPPLS